MFFLKTRCAVAFNMGTWIPLVSFALLQDPNVTQLEITLNRARPGPQGPRLQEQRLPAALCGSAQLCSALPSSRQHRPEYVQLVTWNEPSLNGLSENLCFARRSVVQGLHRRHAAGAQLDSQRG